MRMLEGRPASREMMIRGGAGAFAVAFAIVFGGHGALIAAAVSTVLLILGMPLFRRYALARPNARSSHRVPVPQGGGAAVCGAVVVTLLLSVMAGVPSARLSLLAPLMAGVMVLMVLGALDDIRALPVLPRLLGQTCAVALVVLMAPAEWRILPFLPVAMEQAMLIFAGVWFVNLTNFIDGIDGITLADVLPLAAGILLLAAQGFVSPQGKLVAVCLIGAMAVFTLWNWHPARLFLGDVGSLPIGLIGGALLYDLAGHGAVAAAILLPLYPVMDATLTLLARVARRARLSEAHRDHAYQNAVDRGLHPMRVSGLVLTLNGVLVGLAIVSVRLGAIGQTACVLMGMALTVGLSLFFRGRMIFR